LGGERDQKQNRGDITLHEGGEAHELGEKNLSMCSTKEGGETLFMHI